LSPTASLKVRAEPLLERKPDAGLLPPLEAGQLDRHGVLACFDEWEAIVARCSM
jgi:hypothetical protein